MWDHLPEIQLHCQQGSKMLKEFTVFCKSYTNALVKFNSEVRKASDIFQKHLMQQSKKNAIQNIVDHNYFGYSGKTHKRPEKSQQKEDGSPRADTEDKNN